MGTVAGLEIAVPNAWTQRISGLGAHLNQSARNFHIIVNLATWTYSKPLREAQYLQGLAARSYLQYKKLLLQEIAFKSLGYTSAPAAELKFSWTNATSGVRTTEVVILVTLDTKSGDQPYSLAVRAPHASFDSAYAIFRAALKTFRPLATG
jgi:hypothetical protein